MNEQQELRHSAGRMRGAAAGIAVVVAAVHLLLLRLAGDLSVAVVLLDLVLVSVVLGAAWCACRDRLWRT